MLTDLFAHHDLFKSPSKGHSLPIMKTRSLSILCFCLFLLAFPATRTWSAAGNKPELKDIIITTSASDLLLFATVKNGFTGEMIEKVKNGLPITFTFHVELEQVRSGWFDTTLVEATIVHTMRYDSLKQEYQISFSEQKGHTVTTRSRTEAERLMAEVSGYQLIKRDRLIPDASYALHIKATLDENTLPLGMQSIIPFASYWDFDTDWRTIEFRY